MCEREGVCMRERERERRDVMVSHRPWRTVTVDSRESVCVSVCLPTTVQCACACVKERKRERCVFVCFSKSSLHSLEFNLID